MSLLTTRLFAALSCAPRSFFGIPPWYKYLYKAGRFNNPNNSGICELTGKFQFSDITLIALAILDIILRLAGLVAVIFVIYGGIQYIISQGEPEKSKRAQGTIVNALIGMVIAVVAAAVVSYIGNRVG